MKPVDYINYTQDFTNVLSQIHVMSKKLAHSVNRWRINNDPTTAEDAICEEAVLVAKSIKNALELIQDIDKVCRGIQREAPQMQDHYFLNRDGRMIEVTAAEYAEAHGMTLTEFLESNDLEARMETVKSAGNYKSSLKLSPNVQAEDDEEDM